MVGQEREADEKRIADLVTRYEASWAAYQALPHNAEGQQVIDNITAKAHLIATCRRRGVPLVSAMGAAGIGLETELPRLLHDALKQQASSGEAQALRVLTSQGRHQAMLDELLIRLDSIMQDEETRALVADAISREIRTLRYLGLSRPVSGWSANKFVDGLSALIAEIAANSPFSHAANKRLLEATDARDMDSGLQWEILNNEGVGPDMQARIGAFMGKPKN